MASNVSGSCRVWDACLLEPEKIVGDLGDVEHLREVLGEGTDLEEGELIWLTDRTPHESLPVGEERYRQYFRVVTSSVGLWCEQHSTPNRLGIKPDPTITKIIADDKSR